MVCESLGKRLVMQGEDASPQCTLPKVSCIVVSLFFLSRVSIRWSFLRLKADLSS